jgi:hypothetical protein
MAKRQLDAHPQSGEVKMQKMDMIIESRFNFPGGVPMRAYCSGCGPKSAWEVRNRVGDKEDRALELFELFGRHLQVKHRMDGDQVFSALRLSNIRTEL